MSEVPSQASVSVPDRGGKSVQDFAPESAWKAVQRSIALLPRQRRRLFVLAAVIQVSLGILDLIGIALIGLFAATAVSGTGVGMMPQLVSRVTDLLGLSDLTVTQLTIILAVAAVLVLVLKTASSAYMARRIFRFLANRQAEVSASLARRFLRMPLLDVQRWTTSEAIYALGSGVGHATVGVLGAAVIVAAEAFLFLIVGVSLLAVDLFVTLGAVAIFAITIMATNRILTRWGARNARVMTEASIQTLTAVSEALETYRETTVLNRRDLYILRYERLIGRFAGATANQQYIVEVPKYVLEATLYLSILLLAGVQFLTKDVASAATTIAVFLAAGSRVVPSLLRLQGATITIRNSAVSALPTYYLADYLESRGDIENTPTSTPSASNRSVEIHERIRNQHEGFDPHLDVSNISIQYLDADSPALVDASLRVAAGKSVALVGPTGAGKSTLTDVILGVLEPLTGNVFISGVSPREAIDRWPGAITYVPQNVALVGGTVRDNVALGLSPEDTDDGLVWEALERAHIAGFLRDSRDGLDTPIGERGVRLSGGQRQRLGIARALYTRPLLLVLDEATSALDAETERAIVQTLDELEGQVTTITVAHRLATVRRADLILYLDAGRIVHSGTFEQVRTAVPNFDRQASLLGL